MIACAPSASTADIIRCIRNDMCCAVVGCGAGTTAMISLTAPSVPASALMQQRQAPLRVSIGLEMHSRAKRCPSVLQHSRCTCSHHRDHCDSHRDRCSGCCFQHHWVRWWCSRRQCCEQCWQRRCRRGSGRCRRIGHDASTSRGCVPVSCYPQRALASRHASCVRGTRDVDVGECIIV